MTRVIDATRTPRIVIADDAGLIYSDDWRRGWAKGFRDIGCHVTVIDISSLRRAMASGPYSVRGQGNAAALADTIAAQKPDLVWCHHGRAASNEFFLSKLRRRGIPTAVYLCDEPYEVGETARYSPRFDFVFSMDWCTVDTHQQARPSAKRAGVFYLPPCADEDLFKLRGYADRTIPAFFLGNPTLIPREPWLRAVEKHVPGADIRYWQKIPGRPIAKGCREWIAHEDHPQWYGNCLVGLNVHRHPGITKECFTARIQRRIASMTVPNGAQLCMKMPEQEGTGFWNDFNLPASHVNPRAFEFMACGTLVVSDDTRSELDRMFPCAPRASTKERFVELVQHYIEHTDEAEEIGKLCSVLISRRHTYRHRVLEALTRVGLNSRVREDHASSLGEPADWLTPQDFVLLRGTSSSERTGPSEPWSPASGLSWTRTFGNPSRASSLSAPSIVRPW